MRRLIASSLLLAGALGALPACSTPAEIAECPGTPVATLRLALSRTSASCQGDTAPTDGDSACQARFARPEDWTGHCQTDRPVPACCFDNLFPPAVPKGTAAPPAFTIAYGVGDSAAFCEQVPKASPFTGTRSAAAGGEQLSVALDTTNAVLSSCASSCAVTMHQSLTGLVARDPGSGAVTGFTGEHVETASATPSATCAPCVTPCTAAYAVATVP